MVFKYKSLKDISNKCNLNFTNEEQHLYENEIINIFNDVITDCYIKNNDLCYYIANYYKYIKNDTELMEEFYLKSINHGDITNINPSHKNINFYKSLYELGSYYQNIDKTKMVKYYEIVVNHNNKYNSDYYNPEIIRELSKYYKDKENYYLMKKYLTIGINHNDGYAMNQMARYFHTIEQNYEQAKLYYLMAIDNKYYTAAYNLARYYYNIELNTTLMIKYYTLAGINGDYYSLLELVYYYKDKKDYESLTKYAFMILKKNYDDNITEGDEDNFNTDDYYDNETMHILKSIYHNSFEINYNIYKQYGLKYVETYYKTDRQFLNFIHKIENDFKTDSCMICLNKDIKCIVLDRCSHHLCVDCYVIMKNKRCPYCRQ